MTCCANGRARSFALLSYLQHYRTSAWEWSDALLDEAKARLASWNGSSGGDQRDIEQLCNEVGAALDDDLDVPTALATIDQSAAAGVDVSPAAAMLGIG